MNPIASTIPLVGTISASVIISLLVLLLDGPTTALPVAIYYLVYMQLEAYVISPQIMNRAVKVPGVVPSIWNCAPLPMEAAVVIG